MPTTAVADVAPAFPGYRQRRSPTPRGRLCRHTRYHNVGASHDWLGEKHEGDLVMLTEV